MLTHLNEKKQPTMVNVREKEVTHRSATAITKVVLPKEVMKHLVGDEIQCKKGPVFATAIIAGTMAAKKTSDLIPFCHPLPIESCKIDINSSPSGVVTISCCVEVTHKTGVEMEALTGSSIAALTIYDMCKAVSHDIKIMETQLMAKTGGKCDFTR